MWKGYRFSVKRMRKGNQPFLSKIVYKRVRGWTLGRSLPVHDFVEYFQPRGAISCFFLIIKRNLWYQLQVQSWEISFLLVARWQKISLFAALRNLTVCICQLNEITCSVEKRKQYEWNTKCLGAMKKMLLLKVLHLSSHACWVLV